MTRRKWTRDELILAMYLYCQLPFGQLHRLNPQIIQLATVLGRTASSVGMKLCNFASLDPAHQERGVRGLSGASRADRQIWNEFESEWDSLVLKSEILLERHGIREQLSREDKPSETIEPSGASDEFYGPTEKPDVVQVRLAQRFFRRAVLASFDFKCCISGIAIPELLVASHIVPWRTGPENRANPHNGLCLSRIHDGAFDQGLITFDEEQRLVLSKEITTHCGNTVLNSCFKIFEGQRFSAPSRFRPDEMFLAIHRKSIFKG